jgi:hypothetical protein
MWLAMMSLLVQLLDSAKMLALMSWFGSVMSGADLVLARYDRHLVWYMAQSYSSYRGLPRVLNRAVSGWTH